MMFAIMRFADELGIYNNNPLYIKGIIAIITGSILFYILPPLATQSVFTHNENKK